MARNIRVEKITQTPIEKQEIEIIERKGGGHPDSMADGFAEAVSRALCNEYIKKCVEAGVKMSIDSDAHSAAQAGFLELGIAQARRGWAEKKDIINAWPLGKMLRFLKG